MISRKQHLAEENARSLAAFDDFMGETMARVEQLHGVEPGTYHWSNAGDPPPRTEPVPIFILPSGPVYLEEPNG